MHAMDARSPVRLGECGGIGGEERMEPSLFILYVARFRHFLPAP
jgi:hypothetical protein